MLNIKKRIDRNVPVVIEQLGFLFNPLILNFKNEKNRLLIFYFHGLYESIKQKELNHVDPQNNITGSQFSDFIEYFLNHNYHFISVKDLNEELPVGRRYAMITFDDGYFNNVIATNILEKYQVPAIFFITTANVIENRSFWWDIVYKYRYKQGNSLEAIREEQGSLKKMKFIEIEEYLKRNFGIKSYEPWSDIDRPLTESELKHFAQNPFVTIGNHTHNHAILVNYSSKTIQEEFNVSNKILSDITGIVPNTIAFPNGNYNDLVLNAAEEAGFKFAFTTEPNINLLPIKGRNFYCLSRIMTTTGDIKKEGGFYRLGYRPRTLYSNLKKKGMFFFTKANKNKDH